MHWSAVSDEGKGQGKESVTAMSAEKIARPRTNGSERFTCLLCVRLFSLISKYVGIFVFSGGSDDVYGRLRFLAGSFQRALHVTPQQKRQLCCGF